MPSGAPHFYALPIWRLNHLQKRKGDWKEMRRMLLRDIPWFGPKPPALGVETTLGNPLGTPMLSAMPDPTELSVQLCCRKSSSMSSTFASRLRDERSLISMSLICLLLIADVAVGAAGCLARGDSVLSHGRLILNIQGSQLRNTVRTYRSNKEKCQLIICTTILLTVAYCMYVI